jgi:hypothetical protein
MASVQPCALPRGAILDAYARDGAYTDCYGIELPCVVTQAEFVEAFYTTAVFKLERWLIAKLLSRSSTDAEARQLASGSLNSFSAWSVERREPNQILADGIAIARREPSSHESVLRFCRCSTPSRWLGPFEVGLAVRLAPRLS